MLIFLVFPEVIMVACADYIAPKKWCSRKCGRWQNGLASAGWRRWRLLQKSWSLEFVVELDLFWVRTLVEFQVQWLIIWENISATILFANRARSKLTSLDQNVNDLKKMYVDETHIDSQPRISCIWWCSGLLLPCDLLWTFKPLLLLVHSGRFYKFFNLTQSTEETISTKTTAD